MGAGHGQRGPGSWGRGERARVEVLDLDVVVVQPQGLPRAGMIIAGLEGRAGRHAASRLHRPADRRHLAGCCAPPAGLLPLPGRR